MASASLDSLCKGLEVLELASRMGNVRCSTVAKVKGWTRAQASRYLTNLAGGGWLKNVGTETRPLYVLGHRTLKLSPEVHF